MRIDFKRRLGRFAPFAYGFTFNALVVLATFLALGVEFWLFHSNGAADPPEWQWTMLFVTWTPLLAIDFPFVAAFDDSGFSAPFYCVVLVILGGLMWGAIFAAFSYVLGKIWRRRI